MVDEWQEAITEKQEIINNLEREREHVTKRIEAETARLTMLRYLIANVDRLDDSTSEPTVEVEGLTDAELASNREAWEQYEQQKREYRNGRNRRSQLPPSPHRLHQRNMKCDQPVIEPTVNVEIQGVRQRQRRHQ